jgi:hypothetical protein
MRCAQTFWFVFLALVGGRRIGDRFPAGSGVYLLCPASGPILGFMLPLLIVRLHGVIFPLTPWRLKFMSVVHKFSSYRRGNKIPSPWTSLNVIEESNQYLLWAISNTHCAQSAYFLSVTVGGTYYFALGGKHRGTLPLPVTFTTW